MKKMLSFLPFQFKNANSCNDNDLNLLFPELPFCGKRGMICRVEETPTSYVKTLYNSDGTKNGLKLHIPKRRGKTYQLILDEYLKDAMICKEQLEAKYKEYSNNKYKPNLTKFQFIALAIITSLATLSSLPLIFTTTWTGLALSTISSLLLYVVLEVHNKDEKNLKISNEVIESYQGLEEIISYYGSDNTNQRTLDPGMQKKGGLAKNNTSPFIEFSLTKILRRGRDAA